MPSHK
ncbi:unnamed protein product [Linum tenue]